MPVETSSSARARIFAVGGIALLGLLTACGDNDDADANGDSAAEEERAPWEGPEDSDAEGEASDGDSADAAQPAAANEAGGFVLTSATEIDSDGEGADGAPHVLIYSDPGCPACAQFEDLYSSSLEERVDNGDITLEYRSVVFVDPEYSADASGAFACMAEESPENYLAYVGEVTSQAADQSNREIEDLVSEAEALGADIGECVESGTYRDFAEATTDIATDEDGIQGTPTVLIDGEQLSDLMALEQAIEDASN